MDENLRYTSKSLEPPRYFWWLFAATTPVPDLLQPFSPSQWSLAVTYISQTSLSAGGEQVWPHTLQHLC